MLIIWRNGLPLFPGAIDMVTELEHRVAELRFIDGIEKVEHVRFSTGDQFWVRFNRPIDMQKLEDIIRKHGCQLIRFGGFASKLPRKLSEVLWNGVTHVIVSNISGWERFTSSLGLEPDSNGKIVVDLHGPYQIFIATNENGVQILYDYLGVKYVPPAPPTKPVLPVAQVTTAAKPSVAVAPASQPSPSVSAPSPAKVQDSDPDKKTAAA